MSNLRKIKKLSLNLANQIAAGEVIERPAAVVKELVENSIDSGADNITISIESSGVGSITIQDNGCGIPKDELELAITPHATSKVYSQDELLNINTLGFRGEALASINSVSRFKITSKTASSEFAWLLENNKIKPKSIAYKHGTIIEVADLFFNIKARRYFLKSTRTENIHIENTVKNLVLGNFNITFKFVIDNKIIFNLEKADNSSKKIERIRKILGKNFTENSQYISFENETMQISGWLGNADFHCAQNNMQYIFLNNRAVKDKALLHAIRSSYSDYIPEGRSAAFILYLSLDPREVDVNVHPTKSEVRFRKMRLVYDFIRQNISAVVKTPLSAKLTSPLYKRGEFGPFIKGGSPENPPPALTRPPPLQKGGISGVIPAQAGIQKKSPITILFNRYALYEKNNNYFLEDLNNNQRVTEITEKMLLALLS